MPNKNKSPIDRRKHTRYHTAVTQTPARGSHVRTQYSRPKNQAMVQCKHEGEHLWTRCESYSQRYHPCCDFPKENRTIRDRGYENRTQKSASGMHSGNRGVPKAPHKQQEFDQVTFIPPCVLVYQLTMAEHIFYKKHSIAYWSVLYYSDHTLAFLPKTWYTLYLIIRINT